MHKNQDIIRVAIHTPDPLTRVGLSICIRQDRKLAESSTYDAHVIVVAVETIEDATISTLRTAFRDSEAPLLLIVDKHWNVDISTAVECGVRVMFWRAEFSPNSFLQAIHALTGAEPNLPSPYDTILAQIEHHPLGPSQNPHQVKLATREIEVLRLVAEGFELKEIADKISHSERTVKSVLHSAINSLHVRNRAQAVSYAIREGLI